MTELSKSTLKYKLVLDSINEFININEDNIKSYVFHTDGMYFNIKIVTKQDVTVSYDRIYPHELIFELMKVLEKLYRLTEYELPF